MSVGNNVGDGTSEKRVSSFSSHVVASVPATITTPAPPCVALLRAYMIKEEWRSRPFLVFGASGSGKRYWTERVMGEAGYKVVWLYDADDEAPPSDLEGNALFPCYRLSKWREPSAVPSIVVMESIDGIPGDVLSNIQSVEVALPAASERENFLATLGAPASLSEGNYDYHSLLTAATVWRSSGVEIKSQLAPDEGWNSFLHGGREPPVEDTLLAYYSGYNARGYGEMANHATWLGRRISSKFKPTIHQIVKSTWETTGRPRFPELLLGRKAYMGVSNIDSEDIHAIKEISTTGQRAEKEDGDGGDGGGQRRVHSGAGGTYQYSVEW